MAALQRSSETYRRSGSSGTVWEDQKHRSRSASGELTARPARLKDPRQQRSGGHSSGGHGGYRTTGHVQLAMDPPSPRVAACGFCSLFGKDKRRPPRRASGKRRRR